MVKKYRTVADYKPSSKGREKFTQPSETIPGDSLSIREMLEKHTTGIAPMVQKEGIYDDPEDFDDHNELRDVGTDLSEIHDKSMSAKEKIDKADKAKRTKAAAEKKKAEKEALKKELEQEKIEAQKKEEKAEVKREQKPD